MRFLISLLVAVMLTTTTSTVNRAEKKQSVPLWLRREHYAEERGWGAMCEAWDQDHFADVGKMVEPDPQDLEYLAIVIFCEVGADAQSDETRYMVGDVVLNRVADSRFPNTIYEVLTQRAQYGRFYWTDVVWPERASYAGNAHAVERARRIAYDLLTDAYHSKLYGQGYIYQDNRVHGKDNIWSDGVCFGR